MDSLVPVAAAPLVPQSVADVQRVVERARSGGARIAVETTGGGVRQSAPLHGTLLVRTAALNAVVVDVPARVARVGGGALWNGLSRVAAPAGLAAPAVTTSALGIAGGVLTGGIGWLARRYGMASEALLAVELVTADGRLLRADAEHERELFWALRGGGGGLGVITAMELSLVTLGPLHAGVLSWPVSQAERVLEAWRAWTMDAPREASTLFRIAGAGPRTGVHVEAVVLGDERAATAILAPLRALGPEHDGITAAAPSILDTLHFEVPGARTAYYDHVLLAELPPEALEAVTAVALPAVGNPLLELELRHLGGALNERMRHGGALGTLDAEYGAIVAVTPGAAALAAEVMDAVSPWAAGHMFLSFAGEPLDGETVFVADAVRRLHAVKALYDPEDRFLSPLRHGTDKLA
jgi:FAD/FMN-containing dehydrogenase